MTSPDGRPPRARPGRFRRWLLRPAAWFLAALAVLLALASFLARSAAVREHTRALAERRLSELLGREVAIGALALSLVPLSLEAENVALAGAGPDEPALAEIGRLAVEADLVGLSRPVLTLRRVRIERPVFRLALLEDGRNNLPKLGRQGEAERAPARIELRVGGLEIVDGRFELAETTLPLALAAEGVEAELAESVPGELLGRVAAAGVDVRLPRARPYRARLAATVRLRPDGLDLRTAEIEGEELSARLGGEVRWGGGDRVELEGRVRTSARFARELGYLGEGIDGAVDLDGRFRWAAREGWRAEGGFGSPRAALDDLVLTALGGEVEVVPGEVTVALRQAQLYGGETSGTLRFDYAQEGTPTGIDLALARVDLDRLLASRGIELGAPVDGRLSGELSLRLALADLATLEGAIGLAASPAGREGAVAVAGPLVFSVAGGKLRAEQLVLAGDGFALTAEGGYDVAKGEGSFDYRVEAESLVPLLDLLPVAREPEPLWLPTSGQGTVEGRLDLGRTVASELRLDLARPRAPGLVADRLAGTLAVGESGISWLELDAWQGVDARLRLSGRVPFAESEPLSIAVSTTAWPFAAFAPWLPVELPVDGPATAEVVLSGPLAALSGSASAELRPASAAGLAAESLAARLAFSAERLELDQVALRLPAGEVTARGVLELGSEALAIDFEAPALHLGAEPLAAVGGESLAGSLALRGHLGGTLAQPDLAATLTAAALSLAGEPLATPLAPTLELDWREGRLAASGALLGLVGVSGGGPLALGAADLDLRLDVPDLAVVAAALGAEPTLPLAGSLEARLAVTGGLVEGEPLRARLTAERSGLRVAGRALALLEPADVEIDAHGVAIRSLYLGEPESDSELFASGEVSLAGGGGLDLRVQARLAAAALGDVVPGLTASGDLELLAAVRGTVARPRLSGQARIVGGRARLREFPHTFERVQALILLDPDRIVVDSFAAELGGGRLRGDGSVRLVAAGAPPEYRFQLVAEEVVLRYPAGWLLEADADLALVSQPQGRALRGSIELARAFYLRDFPADLGQLLVRLLERQRLETAATDEALAATALQVTIVAPRSLRIRNNVADLRASADLALRGTLAQPTVFGRLEAEPGGKIVYAGTEYAVERGRVTLANPARIEPVIDLDARTKVDQYELQLRLAGTLERLDVSFASDPPLPSLDVFGLLAVGETLPTEGAAPVGQEATTAQGGSFGAEAILYNQAASIVSSRVQGLFGLDKLRIDPLTTSRNVVSSARVTVGKRLSRDVYVTYTLDPASTEQQQVQLEWQINEGLVVVLTQNGEESYAADLRWQRRF